MLSKEQPVGKWEREKVRRNLWLSNGQPTDIILFQFLLYRQW